MVEDPTFKFLMSFPCYFAEIEGEGIVSIPSGECRAVVVLSDDDLARRFAKTVQKARGRLVSTIEIETPADLLARLRIAESRGILLLAVDPEGFDSPSRRYRYREVEMSAAIRLLQSQECEDPTPRNLPR